jgi:hypothetical protein
VPPGSVVGCQFDSYSSEEDNHMQRLAGPLERLEQQAEWSLAVLSPKVSLRPIPRYGLLIHFMGFSCHEGLNCSID